MTAIVRAVDLVKVYGRGEAAVAALNGVCFDVHQGEFMALMGPSGSGKSTLMHCLAGLDSVTEGRIWIGDAELTSLSDRDVTHLRRDRIGFVFQAFNLMPQLTAARNIVLPLALAGRTVDQQLLDHLVGVLDIRTRLGHLPSELSGGQQQRVAIARALVSRPDVVFADEPTGNLDSHSTREVLTLLRRLSSDLGQTIVMVTHEPSAAVYADRVVLLADGQMADEIWHPTERSIATAMANLAGVSSLP